jgi:hypothetical protein
MWRGTWVERGKGDGKLSREGVMITSRRRGPSDNTGSRARERRGFKPSPNQDHDEACHQ